MAVTFSGRMTTAASITCVAAPADGSGPAVALTSYPDGQTGNGGFWSKDGQTFFFARDAGLLAVSVKGGTPHTAWASAARARGFSLSPDGARVAFLVGQGRGGATVAAGGGRGGRGGGTRGANAGANAGAMNNAPATQQSSEGVDLIVHTIATNADQKLAHADGNFGGMSWSPDGSKLAFTTSGANGGSDLVVADISTNSQNVVQHADDALGAPAWTPDGASITYTVGGGGGGGQIPHYASPAEIGPKLIFVATENGRGAAGASFIVPASGGSAKPIANVGGGGFGRGGSAWIDATHRLSTQTSNNGLTRTTESVDLNGGAPVKLFPGYRIEVFQCCERDDQRALT